MSFFSSDLSSDIFIASNTSSFVHTSRASEPIPTPLNTPSYQEDDSHFYLAYDSSLKSLSFTSAFSFSAAFQAWQEFINTSESLSFNPLANFSLRDTLLPRWLEKAQTTCLMEVRIFMSFVLCFSSKEPSGGSVFLFFMQHQPYHNLDLQHGFAVRVCTSTSAANAERV